MNANGHGLNDLADTSIVKSQWPDNPHRGVHSGHCGGPQAGRFCQFSSWVALSNLKLRLRLVSPDMTSAPSGGGLVTHLK